MEPGLQFLFLAQIHPQRDAGGLAHLSLLRLAALLAAGNALRRHRPGLELDRLRRRRLVRPDRLRDVHHGRSQLPASRAWAATADRHQLRRRAALLVAESRSSSSSSSPPTSCLAAADCLERQIQIRAGRVRRPRHLADSSTLIQRSTLLSSIPGRIWTASKSPSTAAWPALKSAASSSPSTKTKSGPKLSRSLGIGYCRRRRASAWGATQAVVHAAPSHLARLSPAARRRRRHLPARQRFPAHLRLWTIPVGVAIGFNPKLARVVQPVAQVMASVPATAFFPILLIGLVKIGGGLGIGSVALMLLGTQWYILFNVIAGAMSIPSDLREAAVALQIHPLAALDHADPARHLPLPDHRHGHRIGRRVERQRLRRILQAAKTGHSPPSAWAHRSMPPPTAAAFPSAAGHDPDLADGGQHEPPGLAPPLPPGRNQIQAAGLSY
jgi:hypothetical protein